MHNVPLGFQGLRRRKLHFSGGGAQHGWVGADRGLEAVIAVQIADEAREREERGGLAHRDQAFGVLHGVFDAQALQADVGIQGFGLVLLQGFGDMATDGGDVEAGFNREGGVGLAFDDPVEQIGPRFAHEEAALAGGLARFGALGFFGDGHEGPFCEMRAG